MTFDEKDPPILFYASISESKYGPVGTNIPQELICQKLITRIACDISANAIKKTEYGYSNQYELKLYVLTPEQLERLITERAMKNYVYLPLIHENTH